MIIKFYKNHMIQVNFNYRHLIFWGLFPFYIRILNLVYLFNDFNMKKHIAHMVNNYVTFLNLMFDQFFVKLLFYDI